MTQKQAKKILPFCRSVPFQQFWSVRPPPIGGSGRERQNFKMFKNGRTAQTPTNQPVRAKCKSCQTPTWKIVNLGLTHHLDTHPIPDQAIPAAQTANRTLWKLKQIGHTFNANWYWNIKSSKPTRQPSPVILLEHHCTYPATHPDKYPNYWPTTGHRCKEGQCDY